MVPYPPRDFLPAIPVKSGSIAIASGHLELLFVQRRMSAITLQQSRDASVPLDLMRLWLPEFFLDRPELLRSTARPAPPVSVLSIAKAQDA
jgi:hypothetical protein